METKLEKRLPGISKYLEDLRNSRVWSFSGGIDIQDNVQEATYGQSKSYDYVVASRLCSKGAWTAKEMWNQYYLEVYFRPVDNSQKKEFKKFELESSVKRYDTEAEEYHKENFQLRPYTESNSESDKIKVGWMSADKKNADLEIEVDLEKQDKERVRKSECAYGRYCK